MIARAADMVTLQVLVPVQPAVPDQPVKVLPADAAAVNVTTVGEAKEATQLAEQFMPAGELVTTPEPTPPLV